MLQTLLLLWCAAPYPWHGSDYVFDSLVAPGWRLLEAKLQDLTAGAEQNAAGNEGTVVPQS